MYEYIPLIPLSISIYYFIKSYKYEYSARRKFEAERYFNGSILCTKDRYENVDNIFYRKGLALSRDIDGRYSFKKQAKWKINNPYSTDI